jgi:hypothetical protein
MQRLGGGVGGDDLTNAQKYHKKSAPLYNEYVLIKTRTKQNKKTKMQKLSTQ